MSDQQKPNFVDYINVYDFNCDLPGSKETIKFRPVTTGQVKKLLTYENETNYVVQEQALDELITSCVLSEDFNIDEMYIYDRLFLLIELRKKTKGEVLEFQVKCPDCGSQSLNRVNLDTLEIVEMENAENKVVELGNGIKVHLRHVKRKHQKQDIKPRLFPKKLTEIQQGYQFQVAFNACAIDKIETPDGLDETLSMQDKMYFIENIPVGFMEVLKEEIDSMGFGWKLQHRIECVHCKYKFIEDIPVQQNFFG